MTPKKYLEQIQYLEVKIALKIDQILRERARAESRTQVLSEKVQTSSCGDSLPSIIAKISEFEKELDRLIGELIDLKLEVIYKLDKMTNPENIKILDMKYLRGKSLVEIACDLGYSYRHIKRKHGWALQEFKKFL